MSRALIVVDMLVGFIEEGRPLDCGETARAIVPFVLDKAREFSDRGDPVIFIADHHEPGDAEFERFPPHCIVGSEEAKVVPELKPFVKDKFLIPKTRYSGFFDTRLAYILEQIKPELVEVVGVCTNICVLYTVEELRNRDYPTVVHRDGVASFNSQAHKYALGQMETVLGAEVR